MEISGTGFAKNIGVTFDGIQATVIDVTYDTIVCRTPNINVSGHKYAFLSTSALMSKFIFIATYFSALVGARHCSYCTE